MTAILGIALTFFRGLSLRTWLIGGAVVLASAAYMVQAVRIGFLKADVAKVTTQLTAEKASRAIERDKAKDAALAALASYREIESQLQHQLKEAQRAHTLDIDRNAAVIARLRAERGGLLRDLANFATGGRAASEDTVAAARDRARALGDVLGEALREQEELVLAAEDRAADARALLDAWPVTRP